MAELAGPHAEPRCVRVWDHPRLLDRADHGATPAPIEVLADRLIAAARGHGGPRRMVWLDPGGPTLERSSEGVLTAFPDEIRRWRGPADGPLDDWLDALQPHTPSSASGSSASGPSGSTSASLPRYRGGWLGHLCYEAVEALEPVRLRARRDVAVPLASFARHPVWFRHLPATGRLELWTTLPPGVAPTAGPDLSAWAHWAEEALRAPTDNTTPMHAFPEHLGRRTPASRRAADDLVAHATRSFSEDAFQHAVHDVQEAIRQGEVFQANLAHRISIATQVDPFHAHLLLRRINPSPFAALYEEDWGTIVSNSPERLVAVRRHPQGRRIEARPIAGTRPRRADPAADDGERTRLVGSAKERAEHTMLVDLVRNDLGRVSRPGSVRVDEYQTVEAYSHVHHLVSNVHGALRPDAGCADVVRATFPGGTITGAPKLRSIAVIDRAEPVARGPYTGSLGFIEADGTLDLNILIRTLVFADGHAHAYAGAGIVADSDPPEEYVETLHKAAAMFVALATLGKGDDRDARASIPPLVPRSSAGPAGPAAREREVSP